MALVVLLVAACSKNTSPNNPVLPIKDTIIWSFNAATGTLTISGAGAMTNYAYLNFPPWSQYINSIKQVQVGNGVTSIGKYAFFIVSVLHLLPFPIA